MSNADRNDLEAAISAAREAPHDDSLWDRVEDIAGELDTPDEVAALYREVLAGELDASQADSIGERATSFYDEWFGNEPARLAEVLTRVLELNPSADWAFQRLTVALTMGERWDDLLSLYDQTIESATDKSRTISLLEEASQTARDLANQPDKAIGYLQKLLPLKPKDEKLAVSLERLLEKHERWADLISLWQTRLDKLGDDERVATLGRIASCYLDNLNDPRQALVASKEFLNEAADDKEPCALLERIVAFSETDAEVRDGALDLLRYRYESTDRPREIVRVLEGAIEVAPDRAADFRRESAELLANLGDLDAAMGHYSALLVMDPSSAANLGHLRQLAQRSGNYAVFAAGVEGAAQATDDPRRKVTLLSAAAKTKLEQLQDNDGAISLYQAALNVEGNSAADVLAVGSTLNALLTQAGRQADRLAVIERLAEAESVPSNKRALIGDIARLAEELGETQRAIGAWRARLELDETDRIALDGLITLLERESEWSSLIEALRSRVSGSILATQRRPDLVRIAQVYQQELKQVDEALAAWTQVQTEFGESDETADALAELLSSAERWEDLASLLERASKSHVDRLVARLVVLGNSYREHLDSPGRALDCFDRILRVDPYHEGAKAGLHALTENDACGAKAIDILAENYRVTGDWKGALSLTGARVAQAEDDSVKLSLLTEAARMYRDKAEDREAALSSFAQALPMAPSDRGLADDLMQVADQDWDQSIGALQTALERVEGDRDSTLSLSLKLATAYEVGKSDVAKALEHYETYAGLDRGNLDGAFSVIRHAATLGRWPTVASAATGFCAERVVVPDALLEELEKQASEHGAYADLASALAEAVSTTSLEDVSVAPLMWRVATWQREQVGDRGAAIAALRAVIAAEPNRIEAIRALADLQRAEPNADLFATVQRLADLAPNQLDLHREAAELALEHIEDSGVVDNAIVGLFARAGAAFKGTAPAESSVPTEEVTTWALEKLSERYLATERPALAYAAIVEAARLPYEASTQRSLRVRAAAIAGERLGDADGAIEMYRGILSQAPDDREALEKLGDLLRQENRTAELLSLCQHELGLAPPQDRRLALRLELARLVGEIEERGGRLRALRQNLEESPGHADTIESLAQFFETRRQFEELHTLFVEQADRVEASGEAERAASLWTRAANVADARLGDSRRAIEGHRRTAAIAANNETLDALARLYVSREEPGQAVPWLERLLASSENGERVSVALRLADAHVNAEDTDSAASVLAGAIETVGNRPELRSVLADLYRKSENWEPLADLLTQSLEVAEGQDTAVAYAREAASIYNKHTDNPGKAIPALRKALEAAPDDREMQVMLAKGLRAAGEMAESREILETLVKGFGRRRSKERAAIHVELALLAQAEGNHDEALKAIELASSMDVGNPKLLRQTSELALSSGNFDKAEKSLRALLLVVRRNPPGEDLDAVGESEVLYELHRIAKERGDDDQQGELLESALEASAQSDAEVRRLRRTLLTHDEYDIILRALEGRLDAADNDHSKSHLLSDLAEVLEKYKGEASQGFARRLEALSLTPKRLELHDSTIALAVSLGEVENYLDKTSASVDALRRQEEKPLAQALLMKMGTLIEEQGLDLGRAQEFYKQAVATDHERADGLFALARTANARGDADVSSAALQELTTMATELEASPAQATALYRLASMQVTQEDHREQGIQMVTRALEVDNRPAEAAAILRVAAEAEPNSEEIMSLYERVARASGEWEVLLDFLERRARLPEATPDQIKEAVDLAINNDQRDRGEALLQTAVDAARSSDEGLASAVWAVTALAVQKADAGDLNTAKELLFEAANIASEDEVSTLGIGLAMRARAEDRDLPLAAEVLEFLRARDPRAREVWEPLVEVYRQLRDRDRLLDVVSQTLPTLMDPADRNALRLQNAHFLLETDEPTTAVEILRDALLDNPDDLNASGLLEKVLRESGDNEGLADFLWQRFEEAKERRNPETMTDVAQRLGSLLDEMGSQDAADVYRTALEIAPQSPVLIEAVIAHTPEDEERPRAELEERLLAVCDEEQAPGLAQALANTWASLDDYDGVLRALSLGHKRAPDDEALRRRLESYYRDAGMWNQLAEMMSAEGERLEDSDLAVARFREAAAVYRDQLENPAAAASAIRKARVAAPRNEQLVIELAQCLTAAGDMPAAAAAIADALEGDLQGVSRVEPLLYRASLCTEIGEHDASVTALEEAYLLDREQAEERLLAGLDGMRKAAAERGDRNGERQATLRQAELLAAAGQGEAASDLLVAWVVAEPEDTEALLQLRDLDAEGERWHGVVTACARLVMVQHGEEQISAAVVLAEAANKMGDPSQARQGLEFVHQVQPDNAAVRGSLREVYTGIEALRELANLMLVDAQYTEDQDEQYEHFRSAADILVNQLGDAEAAIAPAQSAQALKPDDHETVVLLADVLTASGRAHEAAAMLEPAIALHKRRSPELASLQYRMAKIAAAAGDQGTQLAWLKKAFDVDRKNGVIAAELAQLATQLQDYDLALKPLRAISLMDTPGPISRVMALLWEAKIEHARGNRAKAELWAKKALREDPDFAEAQEFLTQIAE